MAGKKKPNGYFMFMQAERQKIHAETRQTPSMEEMASICSEAWKNLSSSEKARYNTLAKQEKARGVDNLDRDKYRLNNQGQNIAERQNAAREAFIRRTQEKQLLVKSWEGKNILDVPFYVINFQVMYIDESENYFLPQEIGMVSFTLRDGITKHLHYFVDPGDVPPGSLHLAMKHSENTHQIPLDFDKAETNFLRLWMQIVRFVVNDPRKDEVPPLFCLGGERTIVESGLDFIHYHGRCGEPNIFVNRIYILEDLVMSLLLQSGKVNVKPSESQIQDSLLRNQWDYLSTIRCAYHDELDCSYCSLAIVRRLSFAIFDMLSKILDFKLKEQHMPDETSECKFTVIHPSTSNNGRSRFNTRNSRHIYDSDSCSSRSSNRSVRRSPSPPSFVALRDQSPGPAMGASRNNRVEVKLSDSEDDEDSSDEIKSTAQKYVLPELRKPKTPSMLLPRAGVAYGRGLALPDNMALSSGESLEQMNHPRTIRPPPGFGITGTMPHLQNSVRPILHNPQQSPWMRPSATGQALGISRGRGLPPQIRPS